MNLLSTILVAMAEDWVDRHVARWRDHWIDIHFDDEVEAAVERIGAIARYLKSTKKDALTDTGLQDFEYDTLHMLMIRDTPGHASPTDLAADLGVSPAGMTGRLDGLEKAGWIQRRPSRGGPAPDRRRGDPRRGRHLAPGHRAAAAAPRRSWSARSPRPSSASSTSSSRR